MIDFEHIAQTVPEAELDKIGQALLDGADSQKVKEIFAAQGVELSEKDIAKVMPGIIRKLAADPRVSQELSEEELDEMAGGRNWLGGKECGK